MASFSKKTGYIITDAPEEARLSEPDGSDKSARWRIVRGHQSSPRQNGVRLLITCANSEYVGTRGTDRTDFYRTRLIVERANDIVPDNSPKHLSARPQLDHDFSFVHSGYGGSDDASTENRDLDALFKYCVGPNGENVTVYDLISGKVDCVAVNAPLCRRTEVVRPKSGVRRMFDSGKLDSDGEDMATDWDLLLQRNGRDSCFGMSKPTQPPNLALHRERTEQAVSMVKDYLQKREIERGNAMLAEDASYTADMDGPEI